MKKLILLGCLVIGLIPLSSAQLVQKLDTTHWIPIQRAIAFIEKSENVHFNYREEWLVDQQVDRSMLAVSGLETKIKQLLASTSMDYYLIGDRVILLNNTSIVTAPAIIQFFDQKANVEDTEVIFAQDQRAEDLSVEEILHTVGVRSRYKKGTKSTVAGYIKDIQTDEAVEGAFVYIQSPYIGTSTDANGFYSLAVPSGRHHLFVQSVNMKNTHRQLMVYADGKLDIDLEVDVIALNAVVVNANRELNVQSPQMGLTKIDPERMKIVPALLGEKDLIRVSTTTAGVQYLGEGSAGINIRGGKADQNLFLLDGTPIYNTNHFFGFFSVFNSDALSGMELYKSGIPSEFGGRLSSVFDVKTKKLDSRKFSGSGGIGPVTSRLTLEAPIGKKGPSLMVGGRATYSDYVLKKIKDSPLKNNEAAFYDLVGKLDYKIGEKDELAVSGYYSFDKFQLSSDTLLSYTDFSYSNKVLSFNWKHVFNDKWQGNLHGGVTNYDYHIGYDVLPTQSFRIDFAVKERLASLKFDRFMSENLNLKFGAEAKVIHVQPGSKTPTGTASLVSEDALSEEHGRETAVFMSARYSPSERLTVDAGLRYNIYSAVGPGTVRTYAENTPKDINFVVNQTEYSSGERIATYHGAEPRLSGKYSLNESSSVKASYGRTRQNVHLLLNAASVAPTDIWRLSGAHVKPQVADQWALGLYKNIYGKHTIELSAETYYKKIQNLVDFKVGADLQFNKAIETDLLQGPGKSYGLELSVKKSSGWLTGWINYTYSRSLIQLDGSFTDEVINGGEFFPTGYDKPHYLNSVTNYKFSRRLTMTLSAVYATGVPVTFPIGKWNYKDSENLVYSDRNAFRVPNYFRLDLGINIEGSHKIKKLAHSSWNFSVYNILGRDNVYSVFFRVEEGEVRGYKMSVFSNPIPTITYNFTF
ncbi:Outer membrane receptor proteins, mostly Fe transport [Reichenbachiella faecimaris]|uniref:Outer membrane receptor proteins, mostly Fe transport n=1 Tax=Reichenbachiella faecimaris TaxID=692418 RepID=A0A1W2G6Y1_REIFA|nr:TonB-dependent receptor [Reichenbachiella faecimaris]SMD32274.1 Outer membrane receptor proteins, mostly Fe transport [Reichenbachiella faecimaris]